MTRLDKYLKTYLTNPVPITVHELSKRAGVATKTIYNNKDRYESMGIVFKRKPRSTPKKVCVYNLANEKCTTPLFKAVCNKLAYSLGLGYSYPSDECVRLSEKISLKGLEEYLRRHLTQEETLQDKDFLLAHKLLASMDDKVRASKSHNELISAIYQSKVGFAPFEEQLKCISLFYQLYSQKDGTIVWKHVQARAGASKTSCLNVFHDLLVYLDQDVPPFLTVTNKAVLALSSGNTVHKHIGDILGRKVFDNEEVINSLVDLFLVQGRVKPQPLVFVDEYTMLTPTLVSILKKLYKKIVFVGDEGQLRNNEEYVGTLLCSLKKQPRFLNSEGSVQTEFTEAYFKLDVKRMEEILDSICIGTIQGTLDIEDLGASLNKRVSYGDSFKQVEDTLKEYISLDRQIICYATRCRDAINKLLNGGTDIKVRSKVSLTETVFHIPGAVKNTTWTVLKLSGEEATLVDKDHNVITVPSDILTLAYAITTSAAQGSAEMHVLFIFGTAPLALQYRDAYVGLTRAYVSVKCIRRISIDTTKQAVLKALDLEEGSRAVDSYVSLQAIKDIMFESGLTKQEVVNIAKNVFSNFPVVEERVHTEPQELKHNPNAYSYVLVSPEGKYIYPRSEQKNKTKEQAQYALDTALRDGYTGFLTFNLKAQPYVVFDFDNDVEAIDKFKHLLEQTKGAINSEGTSMHLWFEVDKFYNTEHFRVDGKGIDVLANTNETNVNQKPNKTYNTLDPMPLSEEILALLKDHIKITYNKESRLCL